MDDALNPFPGLRSFEPDEDYLFFGRDRRIDELLARLRRTRFLAVVGASGSGKSSLVRSGLIPSLYSGFMAKAGSSWRVLILRPGDDPFGSLAAALNEPEALYAEGETDDTTRSLFETTLRRSTKGLVECVRQARVPSHENVLVVVDQFEELFRFKSSIKIRDARDEAVGFVKLLLAAAQQEEQSIYVVLTMRSDFIGNCTEIEGLAEAINSGQYLVPRMNREERREAIVGPVAIGGAEITPRLVTRLLNDVGDDPDQLPILQHALMRTWSYWEAHRADGEPLDLRHYEAIGTLSQALSQHAEEAFEELGEPRRRRLAESMFKSLTDRRGVRHPRRLEEICELTGEDAAGVIEVIDRFRDPGRSFLMPPAAVPLDRQSVIDISHESLMRVWTRLERWVEEEGQSAQIFVRLSRAAALHQEDKAGLWRDPELQLALNWRREANPTAIWAERYDVAFERAMLFLEASRKAREQEVARKEAVQRRRLRRARLIALLVGALGFLAAMVAVIAMQKSAEAEQEKLAAIIAREDAVRQQEIAGQQRQIAVDKSEEAEQRRLAAEAAEAEAEAARLEAEDREQEARQERERAVRSEAEASQQREVAESAQAEAETRRIQAERERVLADEAKDQAERSERESQRLRRLAIARRLAVESVRLAGSGERDLTAHLAVQAYVMNRRDGGPDQQPAIDEALRTSLRAVAGEEGGRWGGFDAAVRGIAFSPDSNRLFAASDDGRVLSLAWRDTVQEMSWGDSMDHALDVADVDGAIRSLANSSDGRWLAVGRRDGAVAIHDLEGATTIWLSESTGSPQMLVFAEDTLVVGNREGVVRLGSPSAGVLGELLASTNRGAVQALAAKPVGGQVAIGRESGAVELFDVHAPGAAPRTVDGPAGLRSLALGARGRLLAAGGPDGSIELWDLETGRRRVLQGHAAAVTALAFDPEGTILASGSLDNTVRLWNLLEDRPQPLVLRAHRSWIWSLAFSPDGTVIASGGADRAVHLWWTRASDIAAVLCRRIEGGVAEEQWAEILPEVEYEIPCASIDSAPALQAAGGDR